MAGGVYAELIQLVKRMTTLLRELEMFCGQIGMDKKGKEQLRNMLHRSKRELGGLCWYEGVNPMEALVRPNIQLIRKMELSQTRRAMDFFAATASNSLANAKKNGGNVRIRTKAQDAFKKVKNMEPVFRDMDARLKELKQYPAVEVKMAEGVSTLYLQQKKTVEFIFTGPAEVCAGLVIWHVEGTGGHKKGIDTNEADFKKLVGGFETDRIAVNNVRENYHAIMFQIPESGKEIRVKFRFKELSGKFLFIAAAGESTTVLEHYLGNIRIHEPIKRGAFEVTAIYQPGLVSASDFANEANFRDMADSKGKAYYDGNLVYYQGGNEQAYHPLTKSHYCQPELLEKLCEVANRFGNQYPGGRIWINDMSLPYGGTFKAGNKASKGHNTHKAGRQVDISFRNMTSADPGNPLVLKMQRIVLDEIIRSVFGERNALFHGGPWGWHWHCSLDPNRSRSRPILDTFADYFRNAKKPEDFILFLIKYGFYEDVMRIIKHDRKL